MYQQTGDADIMTQEVCYTKCANLGYALSGTGKHCILTFKWYLVFYHKVRKWSPDMFMIVNILLTILFKSVL